MEQLAPSEKSFARDLGAKVQQFTGKQTVFGLTIVNNQAAIAFIQLFDALSANVTLGTTNPDYEIQVAASSSLAVNFSAAGVVFKIGLVAGSTTAEKGAAASAAGVQVFFFQQ